MDTEFAGKGIIVPVYGEAELKFLDKGMPVKVDRARAGDIMEEAELEIVVDLKDNGRKNVERVYWTCDLIHEFVTINGDFRT